MDLFVKSILMTCSNRAVVIYNSKPRYSLFWVLLSILLSYSWQVERMKRAPQRLQICAWDKVQSINMNILIVFVSKSINLVFTNPINSVWWKFATLTSACYVQSRCRLRTFGNQIKIVCDRERKCAAVNKGYVSSLSVHWKRRLVFSFPLALSDRISQFDSIKHVTAGSKISLISTNVWFRWCFFIYLHQHRSYQTDGAEDINLKFVTCYGILYFHWSTVLHK